MKKWIETCPEITVVKKWIESGPEITVVKSLEYIPLQASEVARIEMLLADEENKRARLETQDILFTCTPAHNWPHYTHYTHGQVEDREHPAKTQLPPPHHGATQVSKMVSGCSVLLYPN